MFPVQLPSHVIRIKIYLNLLFFQNLSNKHRKKPRQNGSLTSTYQQTKDRQAKALSLSFSCIFRFFICQHALL